MAVEIPVVIDIDAAFADAAKRVKTAIAPLQNQLSKNALNIRFNIDEKQKRSVKTLLNSSKVSAEELNYALAEVEKRILKMQSRGGFLPNNLNQKERDLLNIYEQLKIKISGADNVLHQFDATLNSTTASMRRQTSVAGKLNGLLASYVSIFTLGRFAKQIRDVTGELEYQRVALGHLIQDEEYGARLFEEIKQKAVQSPFRITQLVTYTKQLAAYRIEQERLFDTTNRLADISAGLGVEMNRLILAYGQVRAASVLRGQELRQFTEAGIPLVELLAEKMGELNKKSYTTADVFRLISERAVPFSAIADIFEDLTEKGGMFYQMQEEQAKTLKGRWEKLKDAFDIALQTAGETKTFEWQNKLVLSTLTVLAKNIRVVPKLIEALGSAWLAYNAATKIANLRNIALKASTTQLLTPVQLVGAGVSRNAIRLLGADKASRMLTKSQAILATSTNVVAKAFARLNMALLTNPYFAIGAAVVGLLSMFLMWRKRTDEVNSGLVELDNSIEKLSKSSQDFERNSKLITRYEQLAKKTDRTTRENNRLHSTMSRLIEAFPELSDKIDGETKSLDKNVEALREKNEEAIKLAKEEAAVALVSARKEQEAIEESLEKARKNNLAIQRQLSPYAGMNRDDMYKSQKKALDGLIAKEKKAQEEVDNLEKEWNKVAKRIETLENLIDPAHAKTFDTAWQKVMARMKDVKVGDETINLVSDEDIRGFESLYKGLSKIDKMYKDSSESLKAMKEALKNVNAEHREEAMLEIKTEEARARGYKAMLDAFGYVSSYDRKNNTTALTLLKEEMKNVQDIYKRYDELKKYMSDATAKKKIEEIYGNVTAIDFLSPEDFKKRLSNILSELRKLQGRIKSGGLEIFGDWSQELKDTIKKNEGLLLEAKDIGDGVLSIGYGQARVLPSGEEIKKDMKITEEQANQYLDEMIAKLETKVKDIITNYANGITVNKEMFNILMDLAYNGGPGLVESLLRRANGDNDKIAELLKTYATKAVNGNKALEAGLQKRAQRRSEGWTKAVAQMDEDANAVTQAIKDAEKVVQDIDFDTLKKSLDKKLKEISESMKRSEAARNFFDNILGLTGDNELSASLTMSVYGSVGKDFKDRVQQELYESLNSIDPSMIDDGLLQQLLGDVTTLDWSDLEAHLGDLPEDIQKIIKRLRCDMEKYESDQAKSYAKLLMKFDETRQQEINIENEYKKSIKEIDDGLALEKEGILKTEVEENRAAAIKMAEDRAAAAKLGVELDRELKLSRLKREYKLFFSTIGLMSEEAARKVVENQREILLKQFLVDGNFTKYKRELKALDEQLEKYTKNRGLFASYLSGGIEGATTKISEYADALRGLSGTLTNKEGKIDVSPESIDFVNKLGMIFGGKVFGVAGRKNVWDKLSEQYKGQPKELEKIFNEAANEIASKAQNFQQAMFWVDFWVNLAGGAISSLGEIASFNKKVTDEFSDEWNTAARVILGVMSLGTSETMGNTETDSMDRLLALNEKAMSGFQKFKSGDIIGSLLDNVIGWAEVFGVSTKKIDREIKQQSDHIEDLEYQYGRLEKEIEKAFGSDYIANYNKQLDVLYAKQEAYLEQARLEREKGKKADEDAAKGYEKQAREVSDQILDMQGQLAEFFAGTDLTSAATDFATAWIDAYKEFGSTTDAMREKFNDMLESMVTNSLAARVMQNILQPLFDEIDTMAKDGELSANEIAQIAQASPEYIEKINNAMTALMNQLTAAGYNIRQQPGQFTGIKRNIANATEESVNGLTQAMNVNNFYMSHIPGLAANVAQILAIMSGGNAEGANTTASLTFSNELAMQYLSALPNIDQNISEILRYVKSVVSDKSSATNINVVAVRA